MWIYDIHYPKACICGFVKGNKLMKNILVALSILVIFNPGKLCADMLSNPGVQVGKKNLFVGIEYSNMMHEYELDTDGLDTSSERVSLKVTTGLNDWLDIYVKAGGASLMLDYKEKSNAVKNYDSNMELGFGAGARLRLLNFIDSQTRVFLQGGGFFFKTDDDIQWELDALSSFSKERELKWADMYAGLGISKRMDIVDLNFGVGFSQIKWWIQDVEMTKIGNAVTSSTKPERSSFENLNPIYGFIGLDFVLPYEYRISAQVGVRNLDEAEFNIALSQGLERD